MTSLQVDLDNNVAVQNDFARLSQSLQVELEKIRQAEKEVGRWSMYWLNMSYACAWRMTSTSAFMSPETFVMPSSIGAECSAFPSFSCVKTIESVYTRWGGWGCGGQVEWFNDLVFTVVRGAVSVVRSGEVISVLREEEDQVISFNLNLSQ